MRTASRTRSCGCIRCRSCRACGRWAPVPRWTIRPVPVPLSRPPRPARADGSPQWYTVVGGSRTYVDAIADRLPDVARRPRGGERRCATTPGSRCRTARERGANTTAIVIATHADQALDLLADASREEKDVLGRSATPAARPSCTPMPVCSRPHRGPARRGTTSRQRRPTDDHAPVVTYWMNRLQGLDSAEPVPGDAQRS